ncbi:hypothetical protein MPSEU_000455900 [Mayamaea pseudoterrestris]|nr:hypothetical protein MPSEU_000455900 [Mayamaea pseudoterrestris]
MSGFGWSPRKNVDACYSRRSMLETATKALVTIAATTTTFSSPSLAAATPTPQELEKLQRGHARVQYLLKNWDSITKVCGTSIMSDAERKQVVRTEGGGGTDQCSRSPLRVQDYMGYKSTNDPLFKAEKLLVRAAPLVDPDNFETYLDAVERYKEKSDQTALLAYTSSWGEANPNGGKEVIDDYLDQTKRQVEESEQLLRTCLKYLNLDVLPPSI